MAITHVGSSQTAAAGVTSLTVGRPAVQAGDVMLVIIIVTANSGTLVPAAPGGWRLVSDNPNGYRRTRVFYKTAGVSEPSSYAFTWTNSADAVAGIAVYRGVHVEAPIAAVASNQHLDHSTQSTSNTASSTGSALPRTYNPFPNGWVVGLKSIDQFETSSPPAGYTNRVDYQYSGGYNSGVDIVDKTVAAVGDVPAASFGGGGGAHATTHVVLREASAEAATVTLKGVTVTQRRESMLGSAVYVTVPANARVDDVVLVTIQTDGTLTPPAGWTLLRSEGTSPALHTYVKRITASDLTGSVLQFTLSTAAAVSAVFVAVFEAADGNVLATGFGGDTTTPYTLASLTTPENNGVLYALAHTGGGVAEMPAVPSGMTELDRRSNGLGSGGNSVGLAAAFEARPTAGATGTRSFTTGTNVTVSGQMFALVTEHRPAAPTVSSPADNAAVRLTEGVTFAWTHNDVVDADPQSGWAIKRRSVTFDPAGAMGPLSYGAVEWWNEADQVIAKDIVTASVSGDIQSPQATQHSNQRRLDRCQNGVLWGVYDRQSSLGEIRLIYSTDGVSWAERSYDIHSSGGRSYVPNYSIFIDLDDFLHVVYKDQGNGLIYHRRATPNAARTAWTFGAATQVVNSTYWDVPDLVVHREGTGWVVHIVMATWSGGQTSTQYKRLVLNSSGAVTSMSTGEALDTSYSSGQSGSVFPDSGAFTGASERAFPSIDFHHTGDGKTVQGGTPHLYIAGSSGKAGSGFGTRFRKATYSAGVWSWGTAREIDANRYIQLALGNWLVCMFDGTRVVMPGVLYDGSSYDLVLHERDAADTTTTPRTLLENPSLSDYMISGSATYDAAGNVYLFGANDNETATTRDLVRRVWTRAGGSLSAETLLDTAVASPYVAARRGVSHSHIDFIYTDNTSPISVRYGTIATPLANRWVGFEVTNAGAATSKTLVDWSADDATYQYAIATADEELIGTYTPWRNLNPYEWWDGAAWVPMEEQWVTSAVTAASPPGSDFAAGSYEWNVATKDPMNYRSPYAAAWDEFSLTAFERWGMAFI